MGSHMGRVPPASLQPLAVLRSVLLWAPMASVCQRRQMPRNAAVDPSCHMSADVSIHILLNQIAFFTLFLPAESPCVARGRFALGSGEEGLGVRFQTAPG